jgi:thiol-disulfide isomerase/thioredoxin
MDGAVNERYRHSIPWANAWGIALGLGLHCAFVAATETPAQVDIIQLRQTDASLRETYAKGKRMGLPRMVMLDGQGRLIHGETGLRDGLGGRLHAALKQDKPIAVPITLDAILAEVEGTDGKPVLVESLPKADFYVIDYWAEWCGPCRMLAHDLDGILKRWDGAHAVWLKIESDPQKLPEHGKNRS